MGRRIACGRGCKYEDWMLLKIAYSLFHAHFFIDGVEFFVLAFVYKCEYHVICWCATFAMVAQQIVSTPFMNDIYLNVMPVLIAMGIPCSVSISLYCFRTCVCLCV